MIKISNKIRTAVWFLTIILFMTGIYMMYRDPKQITAANIFLTAILLIALFELEPKEEKIV